ncbi:MAG TPA: oleate hydratase [Roseiarcus sp.]|nr:oleate hydratase [Roseiarcus sp.]
MNARVSLPAKAHLVGSGIASLAAAVYLVKDAGVVPEKITIYEAEAGFGGAMTKAMKTGPGTPTPPGFGYVLPATRILDREYRCTYDLFSHFRSVSDRQESIHEDVLEFNRTYPYEDGARLLDAAGRVVSSKHFGVSFADRVNLLLLLLRSEASLEGKPISDFFSLHFYESEFWIAWSSMMGPLPEHSAIEMRRYLVRFLHVLPDVLSMTSVWRMRMNQYDSVAAPLHDWLVGQGVSFETDAFVDDVEFDSNAGAVAATSMSVKSGAGDRTVAVDPEHDVVLMTLGSQVADMTIGSMTSAAQKRNPPGRSWALWAKIAATHPEFGKPEAFFGPDIVPHAMWVTFTVTTYEPTFYECLAMRTNSGSRQTGLVTLVDSPWLITVAPFPEPHFAGQSPLTKVWWGYGIHPMEAGRHVNGKAMHECSGSEILKETVLEFGFGDKLPAILASSDCVPCVLPYAGSVWMVRRKADRPKVIPDGAKNFAFIGQFCEIPKDTMFTMEYSVRSARTAVSGLFGLPDETPPVYEGWKDLRAVGAAIRTFLL